MRLSLTDRCDLACVYCRPAGGESFLEERLDASAFAAMLDGLLAAGVRRVRVTGGEPLLHRDVIDRVRAIAARGFDDVALTTNGTRLAALAEPLRRAGLQRITISIDSLDPERFRRMTRGGRLDKVLAGIEAATRAGFREVKLNAVVVRGENDRELADLARFAWDRGITPRFIEVMRVGEGARLDPSALVPIGEMRAALADLVADDDAVVDPDRGPAKYVAARHDPTKRVGFITGTTDTFCAGCDRLRVAADGTVRACLATDDGVAAHEVPGVTERVAAAWAKKPDGATWRGCTEESAARVSMRAVGG